MVGYIFRRPLVVVHPAIRAGLIGRGVGKVEAGLVFEVVSKKRGFDTLAIFVADCLAEGEWSEMAFGARPAAVTPRAEDHKDAMQWVSGLIMRLKGGVFRLGTPEIFLVPPATDFQRRHGDGVELILNGAALPEAVVGGVVEERFPRGQIGCAGLLAGTGEGAGMEEPGVSVFIELAEGVLFARLHPKDVVEPVGLAESAVMEEVVAHPDIGHR